MEYKTRVNETKKAAVESLKKEFGQYSGFIFADYRGMTVEQITEMRDQLREKEAFCKVVKNSYAKIAMEELGYKDLDDKFFGPTAVVLMNGDEKSSIAKVVVKAASTVDTLSLKGAIIDNQMYDVSEIEAYSKLPTRKELIALFMATMKAPVQKLAATLLAYQEKLQGTQEAN